MPRRTVVATLTIMWLAIALSAWIVGFGESPRPLVAAVIVGFGVVGTVFVVRLGRRRAPVPDTIRSPEHDAHSLNG